MCCADELRSYLSLLGHNIRALSGHSDLDLADAAMEEVQHYDVNRYRARCVVG
jgi:hypothetical protein